MPVAAFLIMEFIQVLHPVIKFHHDTYNCFSLAFAFFR